MARKEKGASRGEVRSGEALRPWKEWGLNATSTYGDDRSGAVSAVVVLYPLRRQGALPLRLGLANAK